MSSSDLAEISCLDKSFRLKKTEKQWPTKQNATMELMVSTLAMADALAKLMIAKGVITDAEFKAQLSTERANYLAVPKQLMLKVEDRT